MSDPVKNAEIEDVLSSIRRLVSESGGKVAEQLVEEALDAQPVDAVAEPAAAPEPEIEEAPVERLVLAPSFRIREPQESMKAPFVAEAEAVEDEAEGEAIVADVAVASAEQEVLDAPEPLDGLGGDLEARIAHMEATLVPDEDWEDETLDIDDGAAVPMMDASWGAPLADVADEAKPASEEDHLKEDTPTDDAETQAAGKDEEAPDAFYLDATEIDEEALRDMVTSIVREELQGALGERITRNVRKLVRREIHRALMAQNFE